MEKIFKVFLCILIVACIGFAVYSGIDFMNKQKENRERVNQMLAGTEKSEEFQKELKEFNEMMEKDRLESAEQQEKANQLMNEALAAMSKGDHEEGRRLLEEIRKMYRNDNEK